jgi:hypothetical protein
LTTITRYVHVVRCFATDSGGNRLTNVYVDVQVTDKVAVLWNNGITDTYDFTAQDCTPTIVDNSGGGHGVNNGNQATRQSHIVRVTNPDDSSKALDVEVLDRFCYYTTNGTQAIWDYTAADARTFILSTTGGTINVDSLVPVEEAFTPSQNSAGRLVIVNQINQNSQPDPTTQSSAPSSGVSYLAIEDIQNLGFLGTQLPQQDSTAPDNVTLSAIGTSLYDVTTADRVVMDTTQYNPDGSPPANNDPDPYVYFPNGANFFTGNAVISQGPLWKIINASGVLWGPWLVIYTNFVASGDAAFDFGRIPTVVDSFSLMAPDLPKSMVILDAGLDQFQSFPEIESKYLSDVITQQMQGLTAWVSPSKDTSSWIVLGFDTSPTINVDGYACINLGAIMAANPDATQFSFRVSPVVISPFGYELPTTIVATIPNGTMTSFVNDNIILYPPTGGQTLVFPPPYYPAFGGQLYALTRENGPGVFIQQKPGHGGVLINFPFWGAYCPCYFAGTGYITDYYPGWPWSEYIQGPPTPLINPAVGETMSWTSYHGSSQSPAQVLYQDRGSIGPVAIDMCWPDPLTGFITVDLTTLGLSNPEPAWQPPS